MRPAGRPISAYTSLQGKASLVTFCCAHGRALNLPSCHPERSEGSRSGGAEMLRCAQHDNPILLSRHRHLKAFRMLSSLLVIPATPHTTLLPSASDRLFARVMPPGRPRGSPNPGHLSQSPHLNRHARVATLLLPIHHHRRSDSP